MKRLREKIDRDLHQQSCERGCALSLWCKDYQSVYRQYSFHRNCQPQHQHLDRLSSTILDPFISTYSFNSYHSLNPSFHSSIRNATDGRQTVNNSDIVSESLLYQIRRHSLQLLPLPIVNQALWLYLYPDDPSFPFSISSACTVPINIE
jgi:hypothetical protein